MDKIKLRRVELELTRRCNLHCEHCYCGDAQPVDMSFKVVNRLLDQAEINKLRMIGGEPLLNPSIIKYIANEIELRNITIGSIGLTSNGTIYSRDCVNDLNRIYNRCKNPKECRMYISTDKYHSDIDTANANLEKFKEALRFRVESIHGADGQVSPNGRAKGKGFVNLTIYEPVESWKIYDVIDVSNGIVQTEIFITALGSVIRANMGFSYAVCDEPSNQLGDIHKQYISDMIKKWNDSKELRVMMQIRSAYTDMVSIYMKGICNESTDELKRVSGELLDMIRENRQSLNKYFQSVLDDLCEDISKRISNRVKELDGDFHIIYDVSLPDLKKEFKYLLDSELLVFARIYYAFYRIKDYLNPEQLEKKQKTIGKCVRILKRANYLRSIKLRWPCTMPTNAIREVFWDFDFVRELYR